MLVLYYYLGKLLSKNGQQHLRQFNFSDNQFKKLIFKSTQMFDIFRKVSKF